MAKHIVIERPNGTVTIVRSELETPSEEPLTEHEQIINELYCKVKNLGLFGVSGSLCARGITSKMKEAEEYVKYYIKVHNKPPTYKLVALNLGIGRTAAFARLRHCRELMSGRQ